MKIKKIRKLLSFIFAIILLIFLCSPWISLFMPGRLKEHVYGAVSYKVIADKETEGIQSKEGQIMKLFDYVRMNIFLPRNSVPYKGKPLDYLINGVGWCDYMAKALNCLLAKKGIPSRYAMLLNEAGTVSNHTLNEILIKDKWAVFDPLTGFIFKDEFGQYPTLEEISGKPYLIDKNPRSIATNQINSALYNYYNNKFPMLHPPTRSETRLDDLNIFDHLVIFYVHLFKEKFSNLFQDIYLKIKSIQLNDEYRLYYLARNYHLHYRFTLAKQYYFKLINNYPDTLHEEDSIFFLGLLYINVKHDPGRGVHVLEYLLSKYPQTKWSADVHLYLGLYYDRIGDIKEADINFLYADQYKLPTDILNRIARHKL